MRVDSDERPWQRKTTLGSFGPLERDNFVAKHVAHSQELSDCVLQRPSGGERFIRLNLEAGGTLCRTTRQVDRLPVYLNLSGVWRDRTPQGKLVQKLGATVLWDILTHTASFFFAASVQRRIDR